MRDFAAEGGEFLRVQPRLKHTRAAQILGARAQCLTAHDCASYVDRERESGDVGLTDDSNLARLLAGQRLDRKSTRSPWN